MTSPKTSATALKQEATVSTAATTEHVPDAGPEAKAAPARTGWVEDELGRRQCVWFPVDQVDIEAARRELNAEAVDCRDFAVKLHRRVKWCERYGFPCDDEGDFHTHFVFVQGEPTMTAVWDAHDPRLLSASEGHAA